MTKLSNGFILCLLCFLPVQGFAQSSGTYTRKLDKIIERTIELYERYEDVSELSQLKELYTADPSGWWGGPDFQEFVKENEVPLPDSEQIVSPNVTLADLSTPNIQQFEAAATSLDGYTQRLSIQLSTLKSEAEFAQRKAAALSALSQKARDAADNSRKLLDYFGTYEGAAASAIAEGSNLYHYLDSMQNAEAAVTVLNGLVKNWNDEARRRQALYEQESAKLENLKHNVSMFKAEFYKKKWKKWGLEQLTLAATDGARLELPLSSGKGFPSEFAGTALDGEFSTSYYGNRNGPALLGMYSGSEGDGQFIGVLDRLNRVRGKYSDTSGERGVFSGQATPMLDRVFGSITCTANCDDD